MRERIVRLFLAREMVEPKPLEFVRIEGAHGDGDELFLVERAGAYYVLEFVYGTNLSLSMRSKSTSRSTAKRDFDRVLNQRLRGVEEMGGGWDAQIVTRRMDADAKRHLKGFDSPIVRMDWSVGEELADPQEDFYRFMKKQMRSWKGSSHQLSATRHEYWPTFHEMVIEAVKKKYGASIKLYRGIYGKQALDLMEGAPLAVYKYSSWAVSFEAAKAYRSTGDYWVIVSSVFSPKDIALAPVVLPDFKPDPDILLELAFDVYHAGDELVVYTPSRKITKFKIVYKTRKKRGELLPELVAERFQCVNAS